MSNDKTSKKGFMTKDVNFLRLLIVFVVVFVLCSILQGGNFLRLNTFESMMIQFPEYGLLAVAIGLALLIGGIDLSAVYLANLSAIIGAKFLLSAVNESTSEGAVVMLIVVSFVICILIGTIGGALNGYLISGLGIPAMLATLGTQSLFWGFGVVLTGGSSIGGFPMQLSSIVNASIWIIPISVLFFAVGAIIAGLIVSKTSLGRRMKMYGTNNRATVFAGINNMRLVITTHIICGVLAAMSGIIMWGRYSSVKADTGSTYTMQAILIAVMGGVSPNGGQGNVQGVVVAVLIIQMVSTLMNMFQNIPTAFRQIIWGALLLFVLIFNYMVNERAKKAK